MEEIATIVQPDTILAWHRKLVAHKFDGSARRKARGRPRVDKELEDLVVQMAKENRSWGYDRIVRALKHWGYSDTGRGMADLAGYRNPLAIRGQQGPATPPLAEG